MQSVIMISEREVDFAQIEKHWKNKSISTNNLGLRLVIEVEKGRIYFDTIQDGLPEYGDGELTDLKMSNYNFYSISFTDSVVLKAFILETPFSSKIYIDDDNGEIMPYSEFCKLIE
ncbi:MAG: hypothetical protein PHG19_02370 [Anaerotignum sp.]|nr:hypothetical protein [Anaerotignum sp.]